MNDHYVQNGDYFDPYEMKHIHLPCDTELILVEALLLS